MAIALLFSIRLLKVLPLLKSDVNSGVKAEVNLEDYFDKELDLLKVFIENEPVEKDVLIDT